MQEYAIIARMLVGRAAVAIRGFQGRGKEGPVGNTIEFAGRKWDVKHGKAGPGPNNFSASDQNVWVDGEGQLHLKVTPEQKGRRTVWKSAEVTLQEPLGHGTYDFSVIGAIDRMDANAVLGMFLYGGDKHEADIEISRWGNPNRANSQYIMQPNTRRYQGGGHRFEMSLDGTHSAHRIDWHEEGINFKSVHGHDVDHGQPISHWSFRGVRKYLQPSSERVHINLYLDKGQAPKNGQPVEVVIRDFKFKPEFPAELGVPLDRAADSSRR